MSLTRDHGHIIFECDNACGDTFESGSKSFEEALAAFRLEGWRVMQKPATVWRHFCSKSCEDEWLEKIKTQKERT